MNIFVSFHLYYFEFITFFFDTPLDIAILGSLVAVGPLTCFMLITRYDTILQVFLNVMGVLKARYTTVYILTLFLVGVVPLFHSIISVPFTPVLIFVVRLVNLMVLYNLPCYLLLKDLLCCKGEFARKGWARAIQVGAIVQMQSTLRPW